MGSGAPWPWRDGMKGFQALPPMLESLDVPLLFSPTSLSRARECRLAAVVATGRHEDRLPPEPRAILGTLFHRLVELAATGRLDDASNSAAGIRATLDRLLREADDALVSGHLARYTPLPSTIPYPEFLDRRARAMMIAKRYAVATKSE